MKSVPTEIIKIIKKRFEDYDDFVPGKTKIRLVEPSFGADEVIESLDSLLTTKVTMGEKVKKFEQLFSKYLHVNFSAMVNSGSSANLVALSALTNPTYSKRLPKNSEVITPAVTWVTTVYPLTNLNLKPKFVDISLENFCIDPDKLEEAVTKNTSLLLPVHLLGNVCDMGRITEIARKKNLHVMEDCCEAHGAEFKGKKVGTFGDIGTFSFFLSHHITTIEGGMTVTNNKEIYELTKALRAFGWIRDLRNKTALSKKYPSIDPMYLFVNLGYNLRPTEIQGAFGIHQISKLDKFIKIRKENAKYWTKRFATYEDYFILTKDDPRTHQVCFCYPMTIRNDAPFNREMLVKYLKKHNIETRPIMSGNLLEQPSIKYIPHYARGTLNNSKIAMRNSFFFGNHHRMGRDQREYIVDTIAQFIERKLWKR
ncbi:DegT/DnrJ/EryC1/StrS aminotransferase [Nitrosotalea sinensis]|uniref:DegT/DnrJ/EryC1/StrS aminotransferase n=1 Tax=Nitrosotalea sinensis TaxID=1499975 RepID=A0A2H1EFJ2_9ARCH|nr:DegT/DnrJ/EryC1/StrS family aminotransferase [Candidatus Nitrosotalea sinensis]SHO42821.1 DegT/DnrJ/EryC1/StrS aminotransferase [Candidatus Nitrosotalea sinensis]